MENVYIVMRRLTFQNGDQISFDVGVFPTEAEARGFAEHQQGAINAALQGSIVHPGGQHEVPCGEFVGMGLAITNVSHWMRVRPVGGSRISVPKLVIPH